MPSPLTHDDPARLGPYTLVARLGGGGMGTVYLGRSPGGRTVALKTMHASLAGETVFRTRFRLEIDAARVIGGQYGAQVVDADPLATTPWLATEYVLGPPLDDAVALCGPLPEDAVRALGGALCTALAQLHRSDVVHRDLKPSNILLTATGPKVIDFGIARAAGDDRLTRTGATAGTPAFMSPEQATAEEHTPAGDVFALAGVLVFAVTGRPPFGNGQAVDLLYRVRYAEPDLTAVPVRLQSVLERCLAKNPAERPSTEELGRILDEGNDGGSTHFADRLPAPVLADIARRSAAVWEIRPGRLPAPETDDTVAGTEETRQQGAGRLSRRTVIGVGGGVLAAGAVGGGIAWLRTDEPAPTPKQVGGTGRRPGTAPDMAWKVSVSRDEFRATAYPIGSYVAVAAVDGLRFVEARTGDEHGFNEDITDKERIASDGRQLFALDDGEEPEIAPVDPVTGNRRTPLARVKGIQMATDRLPAVSEELFLAQGATDKGNWIIAYDKQTGEERWRHFLSKEDIEPTRMITPVGRRLIMSSDGEFAVLDARNGRTVQSRKLSFSDAEDLETVGRHVHSRTHVFLYDRELHAIRLSDGKVDWSFGKGREVSRRKSLKGKKLYGPPAVKDGVVYCIEREAGVVALDERSGKVLWEQKKGSGPVPSFEAQPAVGKKYLYTTPESSQWAMAIDLRTHRSAWNFQGPGDNDYTARMTALTDAGRILMEGGITVCAIPLE
ncbi:protein kinase domain-containing protein [Streptomyces olivaceiscleroticus]|uniref:Protein kinase domain-containing protein n=1 Tax=Streptomyces olivaceiscleroticus TaxID=68245 RepID=A0ABP3JNK6_9ACTN